MESAPLQMHSLWGGASADLVLINPPGIRFTRLIVLCPVLSLI